jgi:hypothetical protein
LIASFVEEKFLSESRLSAEKFEANGVNGTAKHGGHLNLTQLLPEHESEHVTVRGFESGDGRLNSFSLGDVALRGVPPVAIYCGFGFQAQQELGAPPKATSMSTQNSARHSV